MDCPSNGDHPDCSGLTCYALVAYIPDPLRSFLDQLRMDLVPGCKPHAHVSVLQPRWLGLEPWAAAEFVRAQAADVAPFSVEATRVEVFPVTHVVYLAIGNGDWDLRLLHNRLNSGPLRFQTTFDYHPHITLAQGLDPARAIEVAAEAEKRWRAYSGPRSFLADTLTFVRSPQSEIWVDLGAFPLGAAQSVF